MSDLSLTRGDPTRTIHFAVTRPLYRWGHIDEPSMGGDEYGNRLAWQLSQDNIESRGDAAGMMVTAWVSLAGAFFVVFGVMAFTVRAVAGASTAFLVYSVCLFGVFFCLTGACHVGWRRIVFLHRARRLAGSGRLETEAYAAAMRRSQPRNTSLVFQIFWGLVFGAIALAMR